MRELTQALRDLKGELKANRIFQVTGLVTQDDLKTLAELEEANMLPPDLPPKVLKQYEQFRESPWGKAYFSAGYTRRPSNVFDEKGVFLKGKKLAKPSDQIHFLLKALFDQHQKALKNEGSSVFIQAGVSLKTLVEHVAKRKKVEADRINPEAVRRAINLFQRKFGKMFPDLGNEGLVYRMGSAEAKGTGIYAMTDECNALTPGPAPSTQIDVP